MVEYIDPVFCFLKEDKRPRPAVRVDLRRAVLGGLAGVVRRTGACSRARGDAVATASRCEPPRAPGARPRAESTQPERPTRPACAPLVHQRALPLRPARATDAAAASRRGAVGRTKRNTWQGMVGWAQVGGAPGRVSGGSAPAKRGNAAEGRGAGDTAGERARDSGETGRVGRAGWAHLSLSGLLSVVRGRGQCRHADGCASGWWRAVACRGEGSLRATSMRGAQEASPSTTAPVCPAPSPAPPAARHLVRRVDVGLVLEQQPRHRHFATLGSHVEGCDPVLPWQM